MSTFQSWECLTRVALTGSNTQFYSRSNLEELGRIISINKFDLIFKSHRILICPQT
jgi:hypothetical protein